MERTTKKPVKKIEFDDNTPMPWGYYMGVKLIDVPAWYLLNLYNRQQCAGPLLAYIEDNLQALKLEKQKEDEKKYNR